MTRIESSAWTLAGGSASVFAIAIILKHVPWPFAFALAAATVATLAWRAPVIEAAALGVIAWLCVTGFDVYTYGDIKITKSDDVIRLGVLVTAGVLMSAAGHLAHRAAPKPAHRQLIALRLAGRPATGRPGTGRATGSPAVDLTEESRDG